MGRVLPLFPITILRRLMLRKKWKNKDVFSDGVLGSLQNKRRFLEAQSGSYPDMQSWDLEKEAEEKLNREVSLLSEELNAILSFRNRIAEIEQELLELKPEQFYFEEYYAGKQGAIVDARQLSKLPSGKLLSLWLEYEHNAGQKIGFFKKLLFSFRFSRAALSLFSHIPEDAIPFVQKLYYKNKISELQEENAIIGSQIAELPVR